MEGFGISNLTRPREPCILLLSLSGSQLREIQKGVIRLSLGGPVSDHLTAWKIRIVEAGIFILFVFTFGDYVLKKVIAIIQPWF